MRTIHLLAALPFTCMFAGGAFAQACTKPLALANAIQMESTAGGPSLVPVKINGTDHKLTLATAATSTTVSEDTIKALSLDPKRASQVMVDDAGNEYRDEVTLTDFNLGRMHGTNVKWPVRAGRGGRGGGGGFGGFGGASGGDGQLGQNYLRVYDLDIDFGSDKLQFFAQDHCPGGVMYWKAPGPVGVLPITIENGRIYVPLTLDGKAIRGVIDTAAATTTVYAAVAQRLLGVELGGPKAPADSPSRGFGGQSYTWTVGSLNFNALALKDEPIMVQPDVAGAGANQGFSAVNRKLGIESELATANVRLGMDVLRKLHLYFAWGENKLYVTGTTNTLPATAAASPPKAP